MSAAFVLASEVLAGVAEAVASGVPPRRFAVGDPGGPFDPVELGPGNIVLVGGAPGSGKTALTMQWGFEAVRFDSDLKVLALNVEMTPAALLERQLARLSGVPLGAIRSRSVPAALAQDFARGLAELGVLAERVAFAPEPTLASALSAADAFRADLIVLDYAQRIAAGPAGADRRASVDALMHATRLVAGRGVGVVLVAAVGRQRDDSGRSSYGGLGLASFRESSELEYGADSAYILKPQGQGRALLSCVKNRNGEMDEIELAWDGATQRFGDAGDRPAHGTSVERIWDDADDPYATKGDDW